MKSFGNWHFNPSPLSRTVDRLTGPNSFGNFFGGFQNAVKGFTLSDSLPKGTVTGMTGVTSHHKVASSRKPKECLSLSALRIAKPSHFN
jgi:hypothetical protein